jgi:hypothetical protein
MKIFLITTGVIVLLFLIVQVVMAQTTSNIEMYPYEVLESYDDFEVRKYETRNFSYVSMPAASYKTNSSKGFRMLAGYIFGDNEGDQKIAMTSPVAMDVNDKDSMQMMFMIPAEYNLADLPTPKNGEVKFKTEPAKLVAAIQFGGWSNDDRIEEHKQKLIALLEKEGIEHTGKFSYLGYNPPYEVINRRNEVIVELVASQF